MNNKRKIQKKENVEHLCGLLSLGTSLVPVRA
jgi:hypothetical protein